MEKKEHKSHEHKKDSESSQPLDAKTIVMIVLVGLLVVVSLVQAIELAGLKSHLADEGLSLSTASKKTAIGASGGSLSKNLDSLPTMVGGC